MKPQQGMRFTHSRIRDKNGPVVCEVTMVGDTSVYYQEIATGKKRSTDVMCFGSIVGRLLVGAQPFENDTYTVSFSG